MFKKVIFTRVIFALVLTTYSVLGFTQEKLEGVVTGTKLTVCNFKPGGCAGSLTMETQRGGKTEQLEVKVPLGTEIRKGNDYTYLPALRGNMVSISHTVEKGETVAKAIHIIKSAKP